MSGLRKVENYVPLIFFQLYLLGTVLLFAFGPWQWIIADHIKLYSFLLAAQVMVGIGYVLAVWRERPEPSRVAEPIRGITLFRLSLAANILFAAPTAWARSNSWIPNIVAGLKDPGTVYMENVNRLMVLGPHVYVEYARILFAVVLLPMLPLTIVYWRSLKPIDRVLAGVTIAWYLSIFVAVGQNKGLADAVATWGILIIAGSIFYRLPLRIILVKLPIACLIALTLFFSYFGTTQLLRKGGAVANNPGTLRWSVPQKSPVQFKGGVNTPPAKIVAKRDYVIAKIAPDFVRNTYESFARYLGQGYQALSFSFDFAHPSTLGIGNSMFLSRNADRMLKTDFFESQNLPGILERRIGWSRQIQWHSLYMWLASDVGFAGTLLVMGLLGFVLAKSWMRTIMLADPLWITMLYMMLIAFFYIPANNQIMQSGEPAIGFIMLSLLLFGRWMKLRFFTRAA